MPIPMMNILNGGSHADNNVDIQEFMIYPSGLNSFSEAIQCGCEIFYKLKEELWKMELPSLHTKKINKASPLKTINLAEIKIEKLNVSHKIDGSLTVPD